MRIRAAGSAVILGIAVLAVFGCARVKVEAPKEAIKVDISMRLDIYQHVEKDIDSIENIVSGGVPAAKSLGQKSSLGWFVTPVYAQEGLSPEVEQAALRRKDRKAQLSSLQASGALGENKSGLVEVRSGGSSEASSVASAENSDRMIIYQAVAAKNGTGVGDVQVLYAKRLQADAPSGTPVESAGGQWTVK